MLEFMKNFAWIFLLPSLGYLSAVFILRQWLYQIRLVHRLRIPIHLGLILGSLWLIYWLSGSESTAFLGRVLRILFYLDLVYLALRLFEVTLLEEILNKRQIRVPVFFRDIARALILVVSVTILMKFVFGIEPSGLLVTSTVFSAIIGLALQDVLANIFSGAALQMERPFQVGDWVLINNREGRIEQMSWRTTKIRNRDNDVIIMPNTEVAKHDILNYFEPDRLHRVRNEIGTSYDDPPEKVKRALLAVVADVPEILLQPSPEVFLLGYGDSSINYELRFWIDQYEILPTIRDRVMSKIWYRFRREGIQIPFPIRTVTMETAERVAQRTEAARTRRLEEIASMMEAIDILLPFSEEQRHTLAHRSRVQWFAPGEHLVRQGERDSSFFIILEGRVSVAAVIDDREKTIGTFGVGYFFGEVALLTGEARTASVIAEAECEALIIEKDVFRPLLEEKPETAVVLSEILQQRSIELEKARDTLQEKRHRKTLSANTSSILGRIQRFFNL